MTTCPLFDLMVVQDLLSACDRNMRAQKVSILRREFYNRKSTLVGRDLIGKILVRTLEDGRRLEGIIVEAEAYGGSRDPASHAFRGKTKRNKVMFGEPGHAYVYFTYGFHHCLNFVTSSEGVGASAVLIRAIEPTKGMEISQKLRKKLEVEDLASGPGKLCQAFAIDLKLNGVDVAREDSPIFVRDQQVNGKVKTSPRIGITTAISRRWRFYLEDNPCVSPRGRLI